MLIPKALHLVIVKFSFAPCLSTSEFCGIDLLASACAFTKGRDIKDKSSK
jgi:hypothetical protein